MICPHYADIKATVTQDLKSWIFRQNIRNKERIWRMVDKKLSYDNNEIKFLMGRRTEKWNNLISQHAIDTEFKFNLSVRCLRMLQKFWKKTNKIIHDEIWSLYDFSNFEKYLLYCKNKRSKFKKTKKGQG